jgi:hypothetical protein
MSAETLLLIVCGVIFVGAGVGDGLVGARPSIRGEHWHSLKSIHCHRFQLIDLNIKLSRCAMNSTIPNRFITLITVST